MLGNIVGVPTLQGRISGPRTLTGYITYGIRTGAEKYDGDYVVIPKAHNATILATEGKLMEDDVTVTEIPYWETSNTNGVTAYIANEV